jgi:hypothetical protein
MGDKSFKKASDLQRKVAYFGVQTDTVYRFASDTDPSYGVPLDPRFDIAEIGNVGLDRRDTDADRAQLSIAILADFLGERSRVARLYCAFSQRIRYIFPTERNWMVTETEIAALIEAVETENRLTWDDTKGRYQDEPDQDLVVAHKQIRKSKKEEAAAFAAKS